MPIKPGSTEWIKNPLNNLTLDDLTRTDLSRSFRDHHIQGNHGKQTDDTFEIPVKYRRYIRPILNAFIKDKDDIKAFLKSPGRAKMIVVPEGMNLFCSFFYNLTETGKIQATTNTVRDVIIKQFTFFRNGKQVTEGAIKNIFKPGNEKKEGSGARPPLNKTVNAIIKFSSGKNQDEVKNSFKELFSDIKQE